MAVFVVLEQWPSREDDSYPKDGEKCVEKVERRCAVVVERESNHSSHSDQAPPFLNNDEADYEFCEIDDEELVAEADNKGDLDEAITSTLVYEVIYSKSYGAPVLYFYLDNNSSATSPRLADLMDSLVPSLLYTQVHQAGVLGAISQTVIFIPPHCNLVPCFAKPFVQDHPVTNMPVYFVHPCRTHQVMQAPYLAVSLVSWYPRIWPRA
ncbi:hypothetical protein MBLNU457_3638t1 [Dothideomycetes sp. NU457]